MPTVCDLSKQNVTLRKLREEMEQTKALYQGAKDVTHAAGRICAKHPYGRAATLFHEALEIETALLSLYRTAIVRLNRWVLDTAPH